MTIVGTIPQIQPSGSPPQQPLANQQVGIPSTQPIQFQLIPPPQQTYQPPQQQTYQPQQQQTYQPPPQQTYQPPQQQTYQPPPQQQTYQPPQQQTYQPQHSSTAAGTPSNSKYVQIGVSHILHQGIERLVPNPQGLNFPGLVRLATINDGSSLLHAVSNGILLNYRTIGNKPGQAAEQANWIRTFRNDLADYLDKPHFNGNGKVSFYQALEDGHLPELSKRYPQYSLENMVKKLKSNEPFDLNMKQNEPNDSPFLQYLSEFTKADIYIVDLQKMDVNNLGITDYSLYYKSRPQSVVVGMLGTHFESIGVEIAPNSHNITFKPDNQLIRVIQRRLGMK